MVPNWPPGIPGRLDTELSKIIPMKLSRRRYLTLLPSLLVAGSLPLAAADGPGLHFPGKSGPGKGKKIVLMAGDEEYRSEEALPMLAKILSQKHGFDCTVLFAVDPEKGYIDPNQQKNIPGTEALADADLLLVSLRFRDL